MLRDGGRLRGRGRGLVLRMGRMKRDDVWGRGEEDAKGGRGEETERGIRIWKDGCEK